MQTLLITMVALSSTGALVLKTSPLVDHGASRRHWSSRVHAKQITTRRAPITALSFDDPAFTVAVGIIGLGLAVSGQSLINSMFQGSAGGSDGLGDFLKDGA